MKLEKIVFLALTPKAELELINQKKVKLNWAERGTFEKLFNREDFPDQKGFKLEARIGASLWGVRDPVRFVQPEVLIGHVKGVFLDQGLIEGLDFKVISYMVE